MYSKNGAGQYFSKNLFGSWIGVKDNVYPGGPSAHRPFYQVYVGSITQDDINKSRLISWNVIFNREAPTPPTKNYLPITVYFYGYPSDGVTFPANYDAMSGGSLLYTFTLTTGPIGNFLVSFNIKNAIADAIKQSYDHVSIYCKSSHEDYYSSIDYGSAFGVKADTARQPYLYIVW